MSLGPRHVPLLALLISILSTSAFADISGTVFRDFNFDSTRQAGTAAGEPGVAGIEVRAYDASNSQVGPTATSAADGSYTLTGLAAATPYRIEFTLPASLGHLRPGVSLTGGETATAFATDGDTVDFAVAGRNDYCAQSPDLITTCFIRGDNSTSTDRDAIVSYSYAANGTSVSKTILQSQSQRSPGN